jgi:hypothetical protein
MPKYQTKEQRHYRYEMLAKAEGDECLICRIEKGIRVGPPARKLIIEHSNNDITDWSWNNLHLSCYSHNKLLEKLSVPAKLALLEQYSDQRERQRQREGLPTRSTVLKDAIDFEGASTEIQLNRLYHAKWLRYVIARIEERKSEDRKRLITAAAKKAGCSKQTSTNYMEVETADVEDAILKEVIDQDGNRIIMFKKERAVIKPVQVRTNGNGHSKNLENTVKVVDG